MNEKELQPVRCGCGGEAIIEKYDANSGLGRPRYVYDVYCEECVVSTADYTTEAEAVQAWNKAMSGSCGKCNNHPESVSDNNVGNKDLISRQELIKACEKYYRCDWEFIKKELFFPEVIESVPSVEPERTKGEWLWNGDKCYCSECGEEDDTNIDGVYYMHDFCQNCGADMRSKERDRM